MELSKKISVQKFLSIGSYEKDEAFRNHLSNTAQRGMFVYGLLGAVIIFLFVILHVILMNKTPVWSYSNLNMGKFITLPDKTLIFGLGLLSAYLSQFSQSLKLRRLLISVFIWLVCMSILMDDIAFRDITFSPAYITIVLIIAVVIIPYPGWQMGLLSLTVVGSMLLAVSWVPTLSDIPQLYFDLSQLIYLFLIAFLLTGMSSQLYIHRFNQFKARQRAEGLGEELEKRVKKLAIMKQKSDQQAQQLLEHEKLKDHFFANLSHEFRTPLTLILGPLEDILQKDAKKEQAPVSVTSLEMMYKNGRRLLRMINQLLDLSKVSAGKIRLDLHNVDVKSLVRETVLSFTPLAESRQITLSYYLCEVPVFARLDAEQIERVLGNLISNAIKFTPENGKVEVMLSQEESGKQPIQINVRDTGWGIAADEIPHIFDRFYQAKQSSNTLNTGTGIGLALSKEIVELHKGTIKAKSELKSGSEFIVSLPVCPSSVDKKEAADGAELSSSSWQRERVYSSGMIAEYSFSKKTTSASTVLIIDDNPDILSYLKLSLSPRYDVVATSKSAEALQLVKDQRVDLIISDIMMPEPDGIELCRLIKENPKLNHIPVILLTAQTTEESRIEGLGSGADDYIEKPFSASELLVRVENLIELRRTLRNKFSEEVRLKGKEVEVSSEDARFLKEVQSVIEENMENSNFTVDWLADGVNLSSRQLQRKIRSITDLSAGGYIRFMRLERASQLLEQEWGNISEIAYKVGIQDAKYFSRLFKQTFGQTPTNFIQSQEQQ